MQSKLLRPADDKGDIGRQKRHTAHLRLGNWHENARKKHYQQGNLFLTTVIEEKALFFPLLSFQFKHHATRMSGFHAQLLVKSADIETSIFARKKIGDSIRRVAATESCLKTAPIARFTRLFRYVSSSTRRRFFQFSDCALELSDIPAHLIPDFKGCSFYFSRS